MVPSVIAADRREREAAEAERIETSDPRADLRVALERQRTIVLERVDRQDALSRAAKHLEEAQQAVDQARRAVDGITERANGNLTAGFRTGGHAAAPTVTLRAADPAVVHLEAARRELAVTQAAHDAIAAEDEEAAWRLQAAVEDTGRCAVSVIAKETTGKPSVAQQLAAELEALKAELPAAPAHCPTPSLLAATVRVVDGNAGEGGYAPWLEHLAALRRDPDAELG